MGLTKVLNLKIKIKNYLRLFSVLPKCLKMVKWLQRTDLNRRPSGYEPDELPLLYSATKKDFKKEWMG